jgi:8-hydroxy-5-deazaflavin:NADPH oxidoreductase
VALRRFGHGHSDHRHGVLGSAIARQLAAGGETLRLSSADTQSARALAAQIGRAAIIAGGNRDALEGADAVVLALRSTVLKDVADEIADSLTGMVVVVPSNPLSTDAQGKVSRVLPDGQSSGEVVAGWLPAGARLVMAFGTLSADLLVSSANRSPEVLQICSPSAARISVLVVIITAPRSSRMPITADWRKPSVLAGL